MKRGILAVVFLLAALLQVDAQGRGGRGGGDGQRGAPASARTSAPFDITGNWTALITDDWEYRMVTPAKGSIEFVPLNPAARAAASAWDPAKDEQAGLQCKGYGAPGLMRLPTRLRISWENDNALKLEADYGSQTRIFNFGPLPSQPSERTWQGVSVAQWEGGAGGGRGVRGGGGGGGLGAAPPPAATRESAGALKVATTNLRAGYLRKNGVPYSENAMLTEWFNILQDQGVQYLAVQTQVDDPAYLTAPFFRTLAFKKEPNGGKWNPTPCSAK